jgi:hypothetical protein
MLKRPALLVAAGGAIAAASGLSVISLGFAGYALLEPLVGRPGAFAIIAVSAAILAALGAYFVAHDSSDDDDDRHRSRADQSMALALTDVIRSRPGVALGASLLLGLIASKNPRIAMEMMSFAQRLTHPKQH